MIASSWAPTVSVEAALTPITQTALTGNVDPDPDSDSESSDEALSPSGSVCLDRVSRPQGWLDLCWQVWREQDGDPLKDYYTLRLSGTASGSGSGIRWWALMADLVGEPGDQAFDGWPSGTIDGPCDQKRAPDLRGIPQSAEICGRTIGFYAESATWAYKVTWNCVGCLLPDHSDREVVLASYVGVPQGTIPTWSIGADFGD